MAPKRKNDSAPKTASTVTSAKHARTAVSAAKVPHAATTSGAAGGAAASAPAATPTLDEYISQGKTKDFQRAFEVLYKTPNTKAEAATSYLWEAAMKKKAAPIIKYLIKCGADVNHQDNVGRTALWFAAEYNIADNVRALLAGGADANLGDKYKGPPLHWGVYRGTGEEVIELLLAAGARVDAVDKTDLGNRTVVHLAAQNSTPNALHALVQYGGTAVTALLDTQDNYGYTPLHHAAEFARTVCALYLLHLGADRTKKNNNTKTPYQLARESDETDADETASAIIEFEGDRSAAAAEAFYTAWHEMVAKANAEEDCADHSACVLAAEATLPHLSADVDVAGAAAGHADHHG